MYRFGLLPLQEEKFHHRSLLMILDFGTLNGPFDFLLGRPVRNSTVAIDQRMRIQIWSCICNQLRVIYPRYDQGVQNPVQSWNRRRSLLFAPPIWKCKQFPVSCSLSTFFSALRAFPSLTVSCHYPSFSPSFWIC
jgi:hypothetical protein